MSAWQPIETAPRDWTDVLVFAPEQDGSNTGGVAMGWYDPEVQKWFANDIWGTLTLYPTHWMPLPAAPAIAAATGEV